MVEAYRRVRLVMTFAARPVGANKATLYFVALLQQEISEQTDEKGLPRPGRPLDHHYRTPDFIPMVTKKGLHRLVLVGRERHPHPLQDFIDGMTVFQGQWLGMCGPKM
jgi:hypothetical protein